MTDSRLGEPTWLSRSLVGMIHADQIQEHGGALGVRDEGLIESALERPRNRFAYGQSDVDLADLAAAYASGLVSNHGFVDGNKRVAFMAAYVFLGLNGYELDAPEPELVVFMLGLAAGEVPEAEFAQWVREHWNPS